MVKRIRLRPPLRTPEYFKLRFWWLHELRILRAKRKIAGLNTKGEIKAAQRALAKIRKENNG